MFTHIKHNFPTLIRESLGSGDRVYLTPDGRKYPSVTTVIADHNKEGIDRWKKRVGEVEAKRISTRASNRGTSVHKALETFLNNEDISGLTMLPDSKILYIRLKQELTSHIKEIHALETPLFSHDLRLAGTTDCVALYDDKLSIVDFKTSLKPKRKEWVTGYFMQGVAYSHMFEEMTSRRIDQIIVLIGVDNQSYCQTFKLTKAEYAPYMNKLISFRDKYESRLAA